MKQILFVLAILISGIASAQLFDASVCEGELVHNGQDYIIQQELQDQITAGQNRLGVNLVCIDNVRVEDGIPYFSRYFRRYLGSNSPSSTGNAYTGEENTMRTYSWNNNRTVIRAYPENYADGATFFLSDGRSRRRLGLASERRKAGMFEVRTNASGSSANTGLFFTAKAAWDSAN